MFLLITTSFIYFTYSHGQSSALTIHSPSTTMAHRRIVSESLAATRKLRPLSILSPPATPKLHQTTNNDTEIEEAVLALEAQKSKVYCEGFILKLDDLTSDGNRVRPEARAWHEMYAKLEGNILSL